MGTPLNPKSPAWSDKPPARRRDMGSKYGTDEYAAATIRRLSIFSDRKLTTDTEVFEALREYEYALPQKQAQDLYSRLRAKALNATLARRR